MLNTIGIDTIGTVDPNPLETIVFEVEAYSVRLGPEMRVIPPGRPGVYARGWIGCHGKHPVSGKRCGLSIYFMPEGGELPEPFYVMKEFEEFRGIFLPFSEMAQYVDLLRNEKPLKAYISEKRLDYTQLFTSVHEPTGESEK